MTPFPIVVAAIDDSDVAAQVLRVAKTLGDPERGGRLFAAHAIRPLDPGFAQILFPWACLGDDIDAIRAEWGAATSKALVQRHREVLGPQAAELLRVGHGQPADAVTALCDHLGPELLVVGRYGAATPVGGWLGSVASRLIVRATCPVVLVNPASPTNAPQRICVALEQCDAARDVLRVAVTLAERHGASLHPIFAVAEPNKPGPRDVRREQRAYLGRLIEGLNLPFSSGGRIEERLGRPMSWAGDPAEAILAAANELGGDLLVVGRSSEGTKPFGRTAEAVVRGASLHTVVVPVAPPAAGVS